MKDTVSIGFIGNPNCGKTTLFNAYTGAKLKVANWPGVTVEKKEGSMQYHGHTFKLVDLPGIYSLTSYTMEEKVSREFILSDDVDVIVDIADASALERNLYLTLQLIELGKPVVLALNMMDIVEERGMEIDMHRLPEMLGIPVSVVINTLYKQIIMTRSIPFSLSVPAVPVARDEMDEAAFHAMMERGLNEAKADKSRAASDVFADLKREMQ